MIYLSNDHISSVLTADDKEAAAGGGVVSEVEAGQGARALVIKYNHLVSREEGPPCSTIKQLYEPFLRVVRGCM